MITNHKKLFVNLVTYQNYTKMHGPKNIKYLRCRLENLKSGINEVC